MGWASAGEIFDPVAAALIEAGASDDLKRRVLGKLIDTLQENDWDTEDESLSEFADDPVIVAEFVKRRIGAEIEPVAGDVTGLIGVTDDDTAWTLTCEGRTGCGELDTRPLTVAGHDDLVRAWATHDQERHDGDGEVPDWMLLGGGEVTR